jgi:predicted nucleic acid-binding protein
MPDRIFVDTLFVVALINDRDKYHEKALELAAKYSGVSLLVTDAVLLEIGNTLSSRFREQAIKAIEGFIESDEVEVVRLNKSLFELAFEAYKKHDDKTWGLVDCISFIVMREYGVIDALTCDKHFVQAGFRALMLDLEN